MATNAVSPQPVALPGGKNRAWERLWGDRTARLALMGLGIVILAIALGPLLYGGSPSGIDFGRALQPPSATAPLGTNDLGQDQLARILLGGCRARPKSMPLGDPP
ncbi:hypothetical protein C8255_21500 [filamentous cyanobacterium CCP3]|nr:hypothetical protein C8255_21500 [filamentous cyanobacterium CCP3]